MTRLQLGVSWVLGCFYVYGSKYNCYINKPGSWSSCGGLGAERNNFCFPDIVSYACCFLLIFVRISSVVSFQVYIQQVIPFFNLSFKRWKSQKNNGKIPSFFGKMLSTNIIYDDHYYIVDIFFLQWWRPNVVKYFCHHWQRRFVIVNHTLPWL